MNARTLTIAVGLLMIATACLLYLEWWRAGELELLVGRVDELELARRRREQRKPRTAATEGT